MTDTVKFDAKNNKIEVNWYDKPLDDAVAIHEDLAGLLEAHGLQASTPVIEEGRAAVTHINDALGFAIHNIANIANKGIKEAIEKPIDTTSPNNKAEELSFEITRIDGEPLTNSDRAIAYAAIAGEHDRFAKVTVFTEMYMEEINDKVHSSMEGTTKTEKTLHKLHDLLQQVKETPTKELKEQLEEAVDSAVAKFYIGIASAEKPKEAQTIALETADDKPSPGSALANLPLAKQETQIS